MPDQMSPDQHRETAERLTAEAGAMRVDGNPNLMLTMAMLALAHATLAGPPTTEVEPATLRAPTSLGWSGAFVLLVLAATVLGAVWLVTR